MIVTALAVITALYASSHLMASASSHQGVSLEHIESFLTWKQANSKEYKSTSEHIFRLRVFAQNMDKINSHNQQGHSWTMKANEFTDLSREEFRSVYTCLNSRNPYVNAQELTEDEKVCPQTLSVELPVTVDHRVKGGVNPIKNQKSCGSCWAFSTIAAVEHANFMATSQLQVLSEQQLVDCPTKDVYPDLNGCFGGIMNQGFQYSIDQGNMLESTYPYTGKEGTCNYDEKKVQAKVNRYQSIVPNCPLKIREAVSQHVVGISINADWLQFYEGGVFSYTGCNDQNDHGVNMVGYGKTDDGVKYFIIRNSWGTGWGEEGYFRILDNGLNNSGICGIYSDPSYPIQDHQ